jgi:putative SOS response-associated peptidase YedK
MCSNYQPVTRTDRLLSFFGVERDRDEPPVDVFPLGLAPFIRLAPDASGGRIAQDGVFGLLPYFATELAFGRRTYNARSETVARLPSFKDAWARGQRCVIPAEAVYEPNWETGKTVRWRIGLPGDVPMGIAGIYQQWRHPNGQTMFTFAMLTVNADNHPVMKRFHRPGDEKRMVVILDPNDYDAWLTASTDDAAGYFRQWTGALVATPAPMPPRPPRADSGRVIVPPSVGDLFA